MASAVDVVRAVQSKTLPASFKANLADDLRQCCFSGNIEECYVVVHDRGCDVNDRADGKGAWRPGSTPLHVAASRGHVAVTSLLLEFRADTSIKDKQCEVPLHLACAAGHNGVVKMLMEAERAKPLHVRLSEQNHERPRVRTRDITNKGRFRLPPTFAMASDTLKQAVASGQSSVSLSHEGQHQEDHTRVTDKSFSIAGNQFIEFEVATFGSRHSRINDQRIVFADPLLGNAPLRNADQCKGNLVAIKRGGRVRFSTKALHAQNSGAVACVFINDENRSLVPKATDAAEIEGLRIPVVGVSREDGRVIKHNVKRDPDSFVHLSFSVRRSRTDDGSVGGSGSQTGAVAAPRSHPAMGGLCAAVSMPSLPYVTLKRSEVITPQPWHLEKPLLVPESQMVRRLLASAESRHTLLRECLERALEVVGGATKQSIQGVIELVHSIRKKEIQDARHAIDVDEQALAGTSASSFNGASEHRATVAPSMSWAELPAGRQRLVERKVLNSRIDAVLGELPESVLVHFDGWSSSYASLISGALLDIHAPFGAQDSAGVSAVVQLLNSLDDLHTMLKMRQRAQQANDDAVISSAGAGIRHRSGAGRSSDLDPATPATPATPAMMRQLLQAQGAYKTNQMAKNPAAKEKLADALELLNNGLMSRASRDMKTAVKLDPVRTGKILGRERALLELNGVGVGGLETGQQRRWSVSSNERYIPQEPSFVLEAGEKGKSVANQQRYCCPLLHSINLVGDTPLHMAARYGHAFIAKVLLEFGAEPSPQNKWELTPLLEAVRAGHVGVVQALLQYGAEPVGATCHDGGTALHIAAASAGFSKQVGVQLMHMLLQATPHGLLPRVARTRDSRGFTPVDIAKAHGGVEMLRVLMESLGPAEFFKTKAEMRMAPAVASGNAFFSKNQLRASRSVSSRRAWETELAELQALKEQAKTRRARELVAASATLLQALCRRVLARGEVEQARAARAAAPEKSSDSSEEQVEEAPPTLAESMLVQDDEVAVKPAVVVGARRSRDDRMRLRRKYEEHMAASGRPTPRRPLSASMGLELRASARNKSSPHQADKGRPARKKVVNLHVDTFFPRPGSVDT